jgi:ABC-type enterobactin transport system permease subunit
MVGIMILLLLIAMALEPPAWVQVLLGAWLALGGAAFAWLLASALGSRDRDPVRRRK